MRERQVLNPLADGPEARRAPRPSTEVAGRSWSVSGGFLVAVDVLVPVEEGHDLPDRAFTAVADCSIGHAFRDIPAPLFICGEIDAHAEQWNPVPLTFQDPAGRNKEVRVFFAPRERGKGIMPTANTYGDHWRKALKAAGLVDAEGKPKYTPHSLRHFFASTALAAGIPIHEVSRWLGHKSIKTTVDIYGHLVPEAWDRCRDIMQTVFVDAPDVDVPGAVLAA